MPNAKRAQYGFSGGMVTTPGDARADLEFYQRSVGLARNAITKLAGGIYNRPGMVLVGEEINEKVSLERHGPHAYDGQIGDLLEVTHASHGLETGQEILIIQDFDSPYERTGIAGEVYKIDNNTFYVAGTSHTSTVTGTLLYQVVNPTAKVVQVPFKVGPEETYMLYIGPGWVQVIQNGENVRIVDRAGDLEVTNKSYTVDPDIVTPVDGVRMSLQIEPRPGYDGAAVGTKHLEEWWSGDYVYPEKFSTGGLVKDRGGRRYRIELQSNDPVLTITGLSVNTDGEVRCTLVGHGRSNGEVIRLGDVPNYPSLSHKEFELAYEDADNFWLSPRYGSNGVGTQVYHDASADPGPFVSATLEYFGGTGYLRAYMDETGGDASTTTGLGNQPISRYLVLDAPWLEADLENIDYAPNGRTLTISCPGYELRELALSVDGVWSLTVNDFLPEIEPPTSFTEATAGAARHVAITSIKEGTGEESLAVENWVGSDATNDLYWDGVEGAFEYNVYKTSAGHWALGWQHLTPNEYANIDSSGSDFTSDPPDHASRPPEHRNPFLARGEGFDIDTIAAGATPKVEFVGEPEGVKQFETVVLIEGCYGLTRLNRKLRIVGKTPNINAVLSDILLSYADTLGDAAYVTVPSKGTITFMEPTNNPRAVAYFQQRLLLGNTPLNARAIYGSASRSYHSMRVSTPIVARDAFDLEMAGESEDSIMYLLAMRSLVVFTTGGVFTLRGRSDDGAFVPGSVQPVPQFGGGCAEVKPIVAGESVIFASKTGNHIIEFVVEAANSERGSLTPIERSTLVHTLFDETPVKRMAFAQSPTPIAWMIREDGRLVGMTFKREFEVAGFHIHDTSHGAHEDIGVIPEGKWSGQYHVVKRTLGGRVRRYFERYDDRQFADLRDAYVMDCGKIYELSRPATTTSYELDPLKLYITYDAVNANVPFITSSDIVDITHKVRDGSTGEIVAGSLDNQRCAITTHTGPTSTPTSIVLEEEASGDPIDATAAFQDAEGNYLEAYELRVRKCVTKVEGFDHLAGIDVAVLADGNVLTPMTVPTSGELDFGSTLYSKVAAGLPIQSEVRTLRPDIAGGPFSGMLGARMKTQGEAALLVHKTQGLKIGWDEDNLVAVEWMDEERNAIPDTELVSGRKFAAIDSNWGEGTVLVRQDDPVPFEILAMRVRLEVEED